MSSFIYSQISPSLYLRSAPERKYAPTRRYEINTTPSRDPCSINFCYDPCSLNFCYDPCCCCHRYCCCCYRYICCEPRPRNNNLPKYNYRPKYNFQPSINKENKKEEEKNNSVKNSKNPQQSEIKEENNENENKNEQPKEEPKENNQNPNIKDNENFEQKQFNEFLKKLINVESQIEEAKVNLANNPDFNCEDAFRLFETNEKGYLDKEDIKKGLNLIGITPTEQELNILMKRFDLQKNNFINYADFFDMVVPFDKDLRPAVENRQPKSPDNFSEKTINDLKNLFELIIKTEMDINNERKNFGTLRLKLKDIFALIDKSGKGFFDIDEMMVYLANNNIVESNKNADLLFIRLDKNRNGKIDYYEIEDELQTIY